MVLKAGNDLREGKRALGVAAVIVLIALALRLAFAALVVREHSGVEILSFAGDSREYAHLAHNLARAGGYVNDDAVSHRLGLLRTPGYPVFTAIFEKLRGGVRGVVWAQAILGAGLVGAVMWLSYMMFRCTVATGVAGLMAALSPTGIGLTGLVLVDLVFALLFVVGFGLMFSGVREDRRWRVYSAGAVFGIGVLVKPTLLFWPVAAAGPWVLMAWGAGRPMRWRRFGVFALIQIVVIVGWCGRNLASDGIFTFSTIDAQNLRHYIAPQVEAWAELGRAPMMGELRPMQDDLRARDADDLEARVVTPAELARRQRMEAWAIIESHPRLAVRAYLRNVQYTVFTGFDGLGRELSEPSYLRSFLMKLEAAAYGRWGRRAVLVIVGLALVLPIWQSRRNGAMRWRPMIYDVLALLVTIIYFAALSGTTYGTGSRIIYPVEFAFVLLAASVAANLRRRFTMEDDDASSAPPAVDDPRRLHVLRQFRLREQGLGLKVAVLLLCGLPAVLIGPFVFACVAWIVCFNFRFYCEWSAIFWIACLSLIPLLFWTERRYRGGLLEEAVKGAGPAEPLEDFAFMLVPSDVAFLVSFAANPRLTASGLVEIFLWGPRQVISAVGKIRGRLRLGGGEVDRAAQLAMRLGANDRAMGLAQLLAGDEDHNRLLRAIGYLMFYDWVGMSADVSRIWLHGDARRVLFPKRV